MKIVGGAYSFLLGLDINKSRMSLKVTGVYFSATSAGSGPGKMKATIRASRPAPLVNSAATTPVTSPLCLSNTTNSQSLDYLHLNFEEKRQIIASSLSLVDFLNHPPKTKGIHWPCFGC